MTLKVSDVQIGSLDRRNQGKPLRTEQNAEKIYVYKKRIKPILSFLSEDDSHYLNHLLNEVLETNPIKCSCFDVNI